MVRGILAWIVYGQFTVRNAPDVVRRTEMLRRRVTVSIERSTWPAGSNQPQRFQPYLGARLIDVDRPLLCIALVNRPPALRGFDLGDTWAWLRYRPALAAPSELRLRQEWTDIDPHQKTVLSDEMGVGFVSYFLAHRLDFRYFGNTAYVANVLMPNVLWFRRRARRGPAKLPDGRADQVTTARRSRGLLVLALPSHVSSIPHARPA